MWETIWNFVHTRIMSRLVGAAVAAVVATLNQICIWGVCLQVTPETTASLEAWLTGISYALTFLAYGLGHKLYERLFGIEDV